MIPSTHTWLPELPLHAPFGAATLLDIRRAAPGLCQPVIVLTEHTARDHPNLVTVARRLFEVAVAPDGELAGTVARLDLAGLTTFHDAHLEHVDAIVAQLAMPGMDCTDDPWDKLTQRRRLAARGLTRVHAVAVDSPGDFRRAQAELAVACVLKPRRGVGGSGLAFVDGPDDVEYQISHRQRWRQLILETCLPSASHPSGVSWLADFVSVETVHTADTHHHVAVFDKCPVAIARRAGADGADAVSVTGDVLPSRLPQPIRRAWAATCNAASTPSEYGGGSPTAR